MSHETPSNQEPIKLDLQKPDVSKLQLTPEEQKSFSDFLDGKKEREKLGIIHISQEELLKLKQSMGTGTLDSFIESQSSESFSSSELIPPIDGFENQKEKLHNLDEASYVYLFKGDNEIFKGHNLSEDAKRNFSTAFSLYLMENLPAGANIDIKNGVKIVETLAREKRISNDPKLQPEIGTFFEKLTEKLALLKNIPSLTLADGGEKNALFMNPVKGLDFLKNLTSGMDISSIIKDADLKDGGKITISDADNNRLQEISKKVGPLLKEIPENKGGDFGIQQLKENPDMLETLKKLSETKPFGAIFKLILTLLGIGDINEAIEGAHYENIKKSFGKIVGEKNLIVSGLHLGNDFMMKGTEKDMSFVGNLRSLSGKGKPDETFLKNLLANKSELDQVMTVKKLDAKNGENINYKNLSEGISLLVGYNAEKMKPENKDLTIVQYIESLNKPKEEAGKEKTESIQGTKLEKRISKGKTVISGKENSDKPLELIEKDGTTIFKYNGKEYQLDVSWFPDKLTSQKKPIITIDGDNLVMNGGNKDGTKPLSKIYEELTKTGEAVLVEDYWGWNDLVIEEVKENTKTKVADDGSNDSAIDDVFKYG